jgi:DNA primase catalytic subunit
VEVLSEFLKAQEAVQGIPAWSEDDATRPQSLAIQRRLLNAIGKYNFVRSQVAVTSLSLWEALQELDAAVTPKEKVLVREFTILGEAGENVEVYDINRAKVQHAAQAFGPYIAAALAAARKAG